MTNANYKPFKNHEKGMFFQVRFLTDTSRGAKSEETNYKEASRIFYNLLNEKTVKEISTDEVESGEKKYLLPSFKDVNDIHYYIQLRNYE